MFLSFRLTSVAITYLFMYNLSMGLFNFCLFHWVVGILGVENVVYFLFLSLMANFVGAQGMFVE